MTTSTNESEPTAPASAADAWESAHPSVRHFQALFVFGHLPAGPLRDTSAQFSALADYLVINCPSNPELAAALRKLREAKDCAVTTWVVDNRSTGLGAPQRPPSGE
jgi:hypothetical protein